MTIRRYDSFNFVYDTDVRSSLLRRQRAYKYDDGTYVTVITPLFQQRVINSPIKSLPGENTDLRRIEICVLDSDNIGGEGVFNSYLPYPPNQTVFLNHIREITDQANSRINERRILRLRYFGESSERVF